MQEKHLFTCWNGDDHFIYSEDDGSHVFLLSIARVMMKVPMHAFLTDHEIVCAVSSMSCHSSKSSSKL